MGRGRGSLPGSRYRDLSGGGVDAEVAWLEHVVPGEGRHRRWCRFGATASRTMRARPARDPPDVRGARPEPMQGATNMLDTHSNDIAPLSPGETEALRRLARSERCFDAVERHASRLILLSAACEGRLDPEADFGLRLSEA